MAYSSISLILLAIIPLLFLLSPQTLAQTPSAPPPTASSGQVNLTGILEKNGQFTTLVRLLTSTQIGDQITNQLNGSTEGMTVFAPTDNAFNTLKAGTLNGLTTQEQVQLILYHVLPKYYTLSQLLTVSNPVRTQASGQDGGVWGLNFTGLANQVNVSTGLVDVEINNVVNKDFPLAVYQLEKVLLPIELFGVKPPTSSPPPLAETPTTPPPAKNPTSGKNTTQTAPAPAPSSKKEDSGSSGENVGLGLVIGLGLMCMGVLS